MSDYRHTPDKTRCKEGVYIKDTYRRTGRGPSGFEMHYRYEQCHRKNKHGEYCWQHRLCPVDGCKEKARPFLGWRCFDHNKTKDL